MSIAFDSIPAPPGDILVSQAQLHGEACIVCHGAGGLLVPAGFFYTEGEDGGRHGWAVVCCTSCKAARS